MFNKLCLIGVGLIGGSIARAARDRGLCTTIVAYGREIDLDNLKEARRLGVIDEYFINLEAAVQGADCIIIATPVGAIEKVLGELKPYWSEQAVYSDVGSTKGNVVDAARRVFGYLPSNFVPAHPIAGAEQSGVTASVNGLFDDKRLIITPVEQTDPKATATMQQFWQQLGAIVSIMEVDHHDAVLAATSHLPHLLAFVLVDLLGRKDEQVEIFKYAAGGFKDFTRIASSDPTMWLDICLANKQKLIPLIQQLKQELDTMELALENDDSQQIFQTFTYAGQARQRFLDQLIN
ncbi:prephenate dehydrogenase [Methylotuvimicrobium alcaliphilum]|uniref:prephenate dehydrogenase n=1 Tax=Methylotuvimicrobium alcaliphilum (strain DSM 19304 / NCIMB 14124 / VKM B-2133 / 20Z) TaxID=1091494 RepID=G4SWG1_META2|nr:prephenate dehydrogenase/arogenate dehydrogenase family protein [Methylotuvimicrobium alcaliphilum]CCE24174.1 Prephenate dehydrogenase (PDH) [Methylotuvimicrobium alcaliphilum 20Z]